MDQQPARPSEPEREVLDADVLAALTAGEADRAEADAPPVDRRLAASVKRKLLLRIAQAETSHRTVPGDGSASQQAGIDTGGAATAHAAEEPAGDSPVGADWRPFLPGIRLKRLHQAGDTMSYLLQFEPGATLPAHRHPLDEECVVLQGTLQIGTQTVRAGDFHLARRDALHAPITTVDGALVYLRGAVPEAGQLV